MHGLDVIKVLNARAAGKEARLAYESGARDLGRDITRAHIEDAYTPGLSASEFYALDSAYNRALQGQEG